MMYFIIGALVIATVGIVGFCMGFFTCAYQIAMRVNAKGTEEERIAFKKLIKKVCV